MQPENEAPVVLGLDIGTVRTGAARADALGLLAHPLCTVGAKTPEQMVERLVALIERERAATVVVGIPKDQRGKEGPQAALTRKTLAGLKARLPHVVFPEIDERFSTLEAERTLLALDLRREKRKQVRDQAAAVLILQTWLDKTRR